jgi:response regulator RpfG family c-di-GMP phosphodiesterase
MQTIDQVLLIDNNASRSSSIGKNIIEEGLTNNIKTTLNGGHALLYLEHASEKIRNSRVLIILNIHTPLVNGFEFLESFKELKSLKKNNILIAVMNDNLNDDEMERIRLLGISDFISSQNSPEALNPIIKLKFDQPESKKRKLNAQNR